MAPLERWEFNVRSMEDTKDTWGTFATYRGVMTERERQERDIASAEHSRRVKLAKEKAKLRRALNGSSNIEDITQVIGRRQ